MFKWLYYFLCGYLKITVKSPEKERFINMLGASGISLWKVVSIEDRYEGYIRLKDFWKLKQMLRKTHTRIFVAKRLGLPFLLHKYHNRVFFPLGIILAFVIIKVCSMYVWNINVNGNLAYTDSTIVKYLEDKGIREGTPVKDISCEKIETMLREDFSEFAWVSVGIKGSRLSINVKENHVGAAIDVSTYEASDYVADRSGIIYSIVTRKGIAKVKKGDNVEVGDVLITGEIDIKTEYDEHIRYDYTSAEGTVYIQCELPFEEVLRKPYTKKTYTGNEVCRRYIAFNNKTLYQSGKVKYKFYDTVTDDNSLLIANDIYTPVKYGTVVYKEYELEELIYGTQEANAILENKFEAFLKNFQDLGVQIIEKNVTIEEYEDYFLAKGCVKAICRTGTDIPINRKEEITVNEHN